MATRVETTELLRQFVTTQSEQAFRQIVENYQGLVYGAARRKLNGDHHLAQDVVQRVFVDLARKAGKIRSGESLGGWLHCHTCFVCSDLRRSNESRRRREIAVAEQLHHSETPDPPWTEVEDELDAAINELREPDRLAIINRFFERHSLRAIGELLNTSEDAAQKRVSRAIDRLRESLSLRGVSLPAAALMAGLTNSAQAESGLSASAVAGASLSNAKSVAAIPLFWKMAAVVVALISVAVVVTRPPAQDTRRSQDTGLEKTTNRTGFFAAPGNRKRSQQNGKTFSESGRHLLLTVLDARTDLPIRSTKLSVLGNQFRTDERGQCRIPITRSKFYVRVDGYADRRLEWKTADGQRVPDEQVVRMAAPQKIGGRVLDAEGNPLAGATVRIYMREKYDFTLTPGRNGFPHTTLETDREGRWTFNRIAPELLFRTTLSAAHEDYPKSGATDGATDPKLIAGTHEFVLKPGVFVSVHGRVVSADGRPVPGAALWTQGRRNETYTDQDGGFTMGPFRPVRTWIGIEAEGFATKQTLVNPEPDADPLLIALDRGRHLELLVQDPSGHPLTGAGVGYHKDVPAQWIPEQREYLPPGKFRGTTDGSGRVVWTNAPVAEMYFSIGASGFMGGQVVFRTNEFSKVFVAKPVLTVRGRVTDAATGKALKFRLVTGAPRTDDLSSTAPDWTTVPGSGTYAGKYSGRLFPGGEYTLTFNSYVRGAFHVDPRLLLRFEAPGYAPHISRVIDYDEGHVVLDVELKPARPFLVNVLDPGGRPAINTSVALLREDDDALGLRDKELTNFKVKRAGRLVYTHDHGSFKLPRIKEIDYVVASGDAGFAQIPAAALRTNPVVRLRPWGRVEGVATHVHYVLMSLRSMVGGRRLWFHTALIDTKGDKSFTIPFAPSGQFELSNGPDREYLPQPIEILPRQTNRVVFDLWKRGGEQTP